MDRRGYQQYKQQSVGSMTSGELLLLLYDELVKRLLRAGLALDKADYPLFEASVDRSLEIIRYLDDTLDMQYPISRSLNLPASETTFRSMDKARDGTGNVLSEEYWQEEEAGPPPRVRDTIYLQLIGIQHTSIQGRICGKVTKKKYITFRSALELIYLLSEAV